MTDTTSKRKTLRSWGRKDGHARYEADTITLVAEEVRLSATVRAHSLWLDGPTSIEDVNVRDALEMLTERVGDLEERADSRGLALFCIGLLALIALAVATFGGGS